MDERIQRGGRMVVEDEGEDRRETYKRRRAKKRWRNGIAKEEVNECPSPDGVVI